MLAEGLFTPSQVDTPFSQERVLQSLIRTRSHVYFIVTLISSGEEAAALLATTRDRRVYLQEGVVLWPIVVSANDLEEIAKDEGMRLKPGLFETVQAFADGPASPTQKVVPMEGQATAFLISGDGLALTNYHVAREEIEPSDRTAGSRMPQPSKYLSFDVLDLSDLEVADYRPLPDMELIANLSASDWKNGWDVALLHAPVFTDVYLEIATDPPKVGDGVWAYGFPMRTQRPVERLKRFGYKDADHSLRVSAGRVTEWVSDHNFVADLDMVSGNSGGPVLDRDGRVVGIVWDVYPSEQSNARPVRFEGGAICVAARPALDRLGF